MAGRPAAPACMPIDADGHQPGCGRMIPPMSPGLGRGGTAPHNRSVAQLLSTAARREATQRCACGRWGMLAVNSPATWLIAAAHIA
jgi:hypothetical protein